MPNHKNIVVMAVSYKSAEDAATFVDSACRLEGSDGIEIILVNNGATAESRQQPEELRARGRNVTICHNPCNPGYLGGLNFGLHEAMAFSPEWIVFCNADIVFSDEWFLERLRHVQVDGDVLALAPAIITRTGEDQNPFMVQRPTGTRWFLYSVFFSSYAAFRSGLALHRLRQAVRGDRRHSSDQPPHRPREIYAPHGACFVLNSRYFHVNPRFDDSLLLWGEEMILAETIREAGGRILYMPDLRVWHEHSGSIGRHVGTESYQAFGLGKRAHRYLTERYYRK